MFGFARLARAAMGNASMILHIEGRSMIQPDDPSHVINHTAAGEPLLAPPLAPASTESVVAPPTTMAESAVPVTTATMPPAGAVEPGGVGSDVDEDNGSGGKMKAAALIAGAAALANKVRQTAPKKVQELREKRAAGRFVVVTEFNGMTVAVGPYRDAVSASDGAQKLTGTAKAIRLMSEDSFLAPDRTATSGV
jgi:hypothetical protein